jgi:hypothetical protein
MPRTEKPKGKAKELKKLRELKSTRQLIAVKKITEIVRNSKGQKKVTLGRILRESGYSDSMATQPARVIQSKSFQALLNQYLPDDTIAEVHGDLLKASVLSHYIFPASEDDEVIKNTVESVAGVKLVKIRKQHNWKRAYFWTPDNRSRLQAIAEAYKVKGRYPAEKHEHFVAKVEVTQF